jgi:hypothetical protein
VWEVAEAEPIALALYGVGGQGYTIALGEDEKSRRKDGAFEMDVQLGFGQRREVCLCGQGKFLYRVSQYETLSIV